MLSVIKNSTWWVPSLDLLDLINHQVISDSSRPHLTTTRNKCCTTRKEGKNKGKKVPRLILL